MEARVDAVDERLVGICDGGCHAIVFAHGHIPTAVTVRWMGLDIADGRRFRLETGSVTELRWKRENRVLDVWNDRSHLARTNGA